MGNTEPQAIATVTVFTRHSGGCEFKAKPEYKLCDCRKSLYIYENGKVTYKSAKTRSWQQAERVASTERDLRHPITKELGRIAALEASKIAEQKAASSAVELANTTTVCHAADRWFTSMKLEHVGTKMTYATAVRKIKDWAAELNVANLRDVTPDMLDLWRGQWSPDANRRDDRMSTTTQSQFQTRVKAFFGWAVDLQMLDRDPTSVMKSITWSGRRTMPLTVVQFNEALASTAKYVPDPNPDSPQSGRELYTLFLLMRWSGLRISDAVTLAKKSLKGNRLDLITIKTKAHYKSRVPDDVVAALHALPQRPGVDPGHFFWSKNCDYRKLVTYWTREIKKLNKFLSFTDEQGQPMPFRSHMLRDTFAVELLLDGFALEDVSRLLTHHSIRTTEKYYAPWITARQVQLDNKLVEAMRRMGATVSA